MAYRSRRLQRAGYPGEFWQRESRQNMKQLSREFPVMELNPCRYPEGEFSEYPVPFKTTAKKPERYECIIRLSGPCIPAMEP